MSTTVSKSRLSCLEAPSMSALPRMRSQRRPRYRGMRLSSKTEPWSNPLGSWNDFSSLVEQHIVTLERKAPWDRWCRGIFTRKQSENASGRIIIVGVCPQVPRDHLHNSTTPKLGSSSAKDPTPQYPIAASGLQSLLRIIRAATRKMPGQEIKGLGRAARVTRPGFLS